MSGAPTADVASLRASEALYRGIVETSHDVVWSIDLEGRVTFANRAAERVLGLPPERLLGRVVTELVAPGDLDAARRALDRVMAGHAVERLELVVLAADGSERHTLVNLIPQHGDDGRIAGVVGTSTDLTGQLRAARELAAAQEQFRQAFENAPIGMALADLDADAGVTLRAVNRELCRVLRVPAERLVGRSTADLADGRHADAERRAIRRMAAGEIDTYALEKRYRRPDGTVAQVEVHVSSVRDVDGAVLYVVKQLQDVTERRRLEEELRRKADHDELTGLFNRRRFEQELGAQLRRCRRCGESATVLLLDIDRFKDTNDTLGHHAGDELIRAVAQRLNGRMRGTDVLARIDGDEFAAILPRCDASEAARVVETLLETLRREPVPLAAAERPLRLTASVGVMVIGAAYEGGPHDALALVDVAMYRAKARGGDGWAVHDPDDDHLAEITSRAYWGQRLRQALAEDQFELFAQPILDLATGELTHQELLLRLREPDGSLAAPGAFLPVAECMGLMPSIDRWVIRAALELASSHRAAGRAVTLEINLSGQSLADASVPDYIEAELRRNGIDGSGLVFEVTETAAIENVEQAREFIGRLKALGCAFALDDFGAGYGSFYYLKHLPFDYLKIDGEFIRRLPESPDDQLIVRSIVDTARGLGKRTVAEFVEDAATLELLRAWGVDFAQGYHVARPGPVVPTGRPADVPIP